VPDPPKDRQHISFAPVSPVILANELDCDRATGWVRDGCACARLTEPKVARLRDVLACKWRHRLVADWRADRTSIAGSYGRFTAPLASTPATGVRAVQANGKAPMAVHHRLRLAHIPGVESLELITSIRDIPKELHLCGQSDSVPEEIVELGKDERRKDERLIG
jgi:hypothetical protein